MSLAAGQLTGKHSVDSGVTLQDIRFFSSLMTDADLLVDDFESAALLGAGFLRLRLRRFGGRVSLAVVCVSAKGFFASLVSSIAAFGLDLAAFSGGAKPKNCPG